MILKLGMKHRGLELYKVYIKFNGDPEFTLTYFTARSNLVACVIEWGKNYYKVIRWGKLASNYQINRRFITAKFLIQGYRYHKLRKAFSKFYRRHYELISKFNVGLKSLLHQGLSEPEFYGDLVYKFKKIRGVTDFF